MVLEIYAILLVSGSALCTCVNFTLIEFVRIFRKGFLYFILFLNGKSFFFSYYFVFLGTNENKDSNVKRELTIDRLIFFLMTAI